MSSASVPRSISLQRPTTNIFDVECPELEDVTAEEQNGVYKVRFHASRLTLTTTTLLGKGGFGMVYGARSNTGDTFALKISSHEMSASDWQRLSEEVTLMRHFSQHLNTVRFICAGRDDRRAYVVMERCVSKTLNDVFSRRELSLPEILWIGFQLTQTVEYIHRRGCVHRDLKPANLLFDFAGNLKISDFGLASRVADDRPRKTVAGTMLFMAPELAQEVVKHQKRREESRQRGEGGGGGGGGGSALQYGREVDVWSVGVVLFVMATRTNPYAKIVNKVQAVSNQKVRQEMMLHAVCNSEWAWPADWSGDVELKQLIDWILNPAGNLRPTIDQIAAHPIWARRPLSCPLSLLMQLGLVSAADHHTPERGGAGSGGDRQRSESSYALTPAHRIGLDEYFEKAVADVCAEEGRRRTHLTLEMMASHRVSLGCCGLMLAELQDRCDILDLESMQRERLADRFFEKRRPEPATAAAVSIGSTRSASSRLRAPSVTLFEDQRTGPTTSSSRSSSLAPPVVGGGNGASSTLAAPGVMVQASPGKLAVYYPGREASTKWGLRQCVSLPRDVAEQLEQPLYCMNKHVLKKVTSMPSKYSGFDCNVCDRGVLTINSDHCVYRCAKCDYDVCSRCANLKLTKPVNFVCVTCAKKFPSNNKLQMHSISCRGPSVASSPGREIINHTQVWEELDARPSLLEVRLPGHGDFGAQNNHSASSSRRSTSRSSLTRQGGSTRLSAGPRGLPFFDDQDTQHSRDDVNRVVGHQSMCGWDGLSIALPSDSVLLPDNVGRLSKRLREEKEQHRAAAAQHPTAAGESLSPVKVKARIERSPATAATLSADIKAIENFRLTDDVIQEPIGIAAQRAQSRLREGSLQPTGSYQHDGPVFLSRAASSSSSTTAGIVSIRAEVAMRPLDTPKQPGLQSQRKGISRQANTESASRSEAPKSERNPNIPASRQPSSSPFPQQQQQQQNTNSNQRPPTPQPRIQSVPSSSQKQLQPTAPFQSSSNTDRQVVSGVRVGQDGRIESASDGSIASLAAPQVNRPPHPPSVNAGNNIGEFTFSSMQGHFAPPPPHMIRPIRSGSVTTGRGSVGRMPVPVSVPLLPPQVQQQQQQQQNPLQLQQQQQQFTSPLPRVSASGAYLALPKQEADRQVFMDQFLGGPWVRFYRFGFDTLSIAHYCLQPGRFGSLFANDQGHLGTAVVDIHSKLVLFVPTTNNDSAGRSQPHPHVQTFYDEEVRLMSITDANRIIPNVVQSILSFANEWTRMKMEHLTTTSVVHSAFVRDREATCVSRDTKFAYLRKVFPDPQQHVVFFRLSNLRSQVILNTTVDIRWQSDRQHNVGSKFYVYSDGRIEPFAEDRTGTLAHMATVMANSYRQTR